MAKAARKPATRIRNCEVWNENLATPEIVFFTGEEFTGSRYRTNCNVNFIGDEFNGKIKSVIIISGVWEFYKDAEFKKLIIGALKVGCYPNVDIGNKGISSAKCISC